MMQPIDAGTSEAPADRADEAGTLSDPELASLIVAQQASVATGEADFVRARDRYNQNRRLLRELLDEQERRRLVASGDTVTGPVGKQPRKKRSTTGMDALIGRDGVDPDAPFERFRFLSLQRQEILLAPDGDPTHQVLAFVDRESGALLEATTFGAARRLHESGHQLGRPGIPLQRQTIWYIGEGRPGRLRLDQMFVEQEGD
jgi:hypothetical protein